MGRSGIYEILTMSEKLRRLVTSTTNVLALREQALKEGMRPLRVSGALKVQAGITTAEEIFNVVPGEEEYRALQQN
ncbi:MAG: hypothetical protein GY731_03975 [Gammaproteobacteria bacterium]|nr:hypothetical protein [Gammaproteobacteria bacterium]